MPIKIILSILIPAFLMQVIGCYSTNEIPKYEIVLNNSKILAMQRSCCDVDRSFDNLPYLFYRITT